MPKLVVESGPLSGERFELPADGSAFVIGRGEDCGIALADTMVSRHHCALRFSRGRWILEDQKSRNGTFVNGAELSAPKSLKPGDAIRVGETLLSFVAQTKDPFLGKTLAGHRIEERLGRGGSGTVYRAVQLSLDRPVAIKFLAPSLAGDEKFVRRFLKEARAAARLHHPNVVQVFDAGQEGKLYYFSMEFLEGGTLKDLLGREGRVAPERAVAIAVEVTEALMFAERHGIVHRDIEPANLLFDGEGSVKLGDLGIAADLHARSDSSIHVAGSPRYMAPEQAEPGPIDHRADVYALGATLFHAIAGEPPFPGNSLGEVIRAKMDRPPPSLQRHLPDISPALANVVRRMMARSPAARYRKANHVKTALSRALTAPPEVPAFVRARARERKMTRYAFLGAAVGAVVVVISLILWLLIAGLFG